MNNEDQTERPCVCPNCGAPATETFIYAERGIIKWDGNCPECQAEWEYFEDKLCRKHEFLMKE
jgi:rubredoxin